MISEAHKITVAAVVIGRNEGERLRSCLARVLECVELVVYVDSESSDGSPDLARIMGAEVVALDLSRPFTAARARNVGLARVKELRTDVAFVQFLDGDSTLAAGWVASAIEFMKAHSEVAAVSGRLRERNPTASIYNRFCDIEWDTPLGESLSCGGNVMIRTLALGLAGGFREDVIAGEEPELCVRLRAKGWKIWRIEAEMAMHDAAMTRFRQWWVRAVRYGYAIALGVRLHGRPPERHCVREKRRALIWGAALPSSLIFLAVIWPVAGGLALLVYPFQFMRLAFRSRLAWPESLLDALFKMAGRFAEVQGIVRFWRDCLAKRTPEIIEYK